MIRFDIRQFRNAEEIWFWYELVRFCDN